MCMKKMFNEGNHIYNFTSSSGSDFLTSYDSGSGSTSQKVPVPPVPVPKRCLEVVLLGLAAHEDVEGGIDVLRALAGQVHVLPVLVAVQAHPKK